MIFDANDDELFDAAEAAIDARVKELFDGPLGAEPGWAMAIARACALAAGVALATAAHAGDVKPDELHEAEAALKLMLERSAKPATVNKAGRNGKHWADPTSYRRET